MMCLESEHYVRLENVKILSLQVECIMNVLENFYSSAPLEFFQLAASSEYDFDSSLKVVIFTAHIFVLRNVVLGKCFEFNCNREVFG